jgi:hypothetical protein
MNRYLLPAGLTLALIQINTLADDQSALASNARGIAGQLVQQLGAELKKELAAGGPVNAISVCKSAAPEIAGRLSRERGLRVARVSLKTRNPLLGLPDAWEQAVLAGFDQRVALGAKPETLEQAEIVSEPQGRYFRYMKAIPVQPLCLSCHGTEETIAAEVKDRLAKDYPHDQARGYSLGQVRGAVTLKQRLE